MTQLAVESGPANPEKIPALGYYNAENSAQSVVHLLDLTDTTPAETDAISVGVTAVRVAPNADVLVSTGPAPNAADDDVSPHWANSSEIVKIAPGHKLSAVLLSGTGSGKVYVTEMH